MSSAAVVGQDHMRVGTQAIRLDMTMSLDGFVVGPQDSTEQPMGIGGFRLFNWLDSRLDPGPNGQVFAESSATRAAQARAAAGGADVLVLGAGAAQALLRGGELDEMELHVVPVLLGRGRRLFDHLPAECIELELTRELNTDDPDPAHRVLHLRYRIQRPSPTQDAGGDR
jgi:hypothetical protein